MSDGLYFQAKVTDAVLAQEEDRFLSMDAQSDAQNVPDEEREEISAELMEERDSHDGKSRRNNRNQERKGKSKRKESKRKESKRKNERKNKMKAKAIRHGDSTGPNKSGRRQYRRSKGNNQGVLDSLCPYLGGLYNLLSTFLPASILNGVIE